MAPFQHGDVRPLTAAVPTGFVGWRVLSPGACAGVGDLPGLLRCCGTSSPAPALLQPRASLLNRLFLGCCSSSSSAPCWSSLPWCSSATSTRRGAPWWGTWWERPPSSASPSTWCTSWSGRPALSSRSELHQRGPGGRTVSPGVSPFVGHPQPGAVGAGRSTKGLCRARGPAAGRKPVPFSLCPLPPCSASPSAFGRRKQHETPRPRRCACHRSHNPVARPGGTEAALRLRFRATKPRGRQKRSCQRRPHSKPAPCLPRAASPPEPKRRGRRSAAARCVCPLPKRKESPGCERGCVVLGSVGPIPSPNSILGVNCSSLWHIAGHC